MCEPEPVELPINGTLDLHAFNPKEVNELVPAFLTACREIRIKLSIKISFLDTWAKRSIKCIDTARDIHVKFYPIASLIRCLEGYP